MYVMLNSYVSKDYLLFKAEFQALNNCKVPAAESTSSKWIFSKNHKYVLQPLQKSVTPSYHVKV